MLSRADTEPCFWTEHTKNFENTMDEVYEDGGITGSHFPQHPDSSFPFGSAPVVVSSVEQENLGAAHSGFTAGSGAEGRLKFRSGSTMPSSDRGLQPLRESQNNFREGGTADWFTLSHKLCFVIMMTKI